MRFYAVIIALTFGFNAKAQITYDRLIIDDKEFFCCYRNPFSRFGLSLSEVNWESGNYDHNNVLSGVSVHVTNSDSTSCSRILNFYQAREFRFSICFIKDNQQPVLSNSFKFDLISHEEFSCDRGGTYKLVFDSSTFKVYYLKTGEEEEIILTGYLQ
jgi:hypothetical protein